MALFRRSTNPLINKVNRPPILKLVTTPAKQVENDPSSSQGNGNAYEKNDAPRQDPAPEALGLTSEESKEHKEHPRDKPQQAPRSLHLVYEELFVKPKDKNSSPGLVSEYSRAGIAAKGVLLNKKVE